MKPRILLIEDDSALQGLLCQVLLRTGYQVETSREGHQAIHHIVESRHDFILLDWDLPGLSGIEITRFVRSNPATYHTPVMMMTAFNDDSHRDNAFKAGVTDYITKPFDMHELLERVGSAFQREARETVSIQG